MNVQTCTELVILTVILRNLVPLIRFLIALADFFTVEGIVIGSGKRDTNGITLHANLLFCDSVEACQNKIFHAIEKDSLCLYGYVMQERP